MHRRHKAWHVCRCVCVCVKGIGQGRLTPNLKVSTGIHIWLHFASLPSELFCVCVFGEHLHRATQQNWCWTIARAAWFFPNPVQKSTCPRSRFSQRSECTQISFLCSLWNARTHARSSAGARVLALLGGGTCAAEGERSAHLSSLKSRCDSKFFRPLWDGRSCYSSQDGGQGSGCLMIEEKRSKFILLRALCQVPVAYCWEPLTHHRVTAPEVTSSAINLPRLLNLLPSPSQARAGKGGCSCSSSSSSSSPLK